MTQMSMLPALKEHCLNLHLSSWQTSSILQWGFLLQFFLYSILDIPKHIDDACHSGAFLPQPLALATSPCFHVPTHRARIATSSIFLGRSGLLHRGCYLLSSLLLLSNSSKKIYIASTSKASAYVIVALLIWQSLVAYYPYLYRECAFRWKLYNWAFAEGFYQCPTPNCHHISLK